MKKYASMLLLGLLAAGQSASADDSFSLNHFTPKVLPVLVQVDRHGKVTDVSPSVELAPRYDRLLRQTLDQMITGPAKDHGRPVASQFVMNLGLQAAPREDGRYDARFVYVSTSPVPAGSWYWVHIDGHRLALKSRSIQPRTLRYPQRAPDPAWFRYAPAQNPPVQDAVQRAPRSTPAGGGRRRS